MTQLSAVADAGYAAIARSIASGRIPGATLGLVTASGARALVSNGSAQIEPWREPLTLAHWFDLAALTQVIATAPAILQLADQGRLDLDRPVADAIPDLRQYGPGDAPERRVTFRELLSHQTHFPATAPIYTYGDDARRLRAFVLQRAWPAGPPVCSDINFILLGIAIERLIGRPLDRLVFPPGLAWRPDAAFSVATERCMWRERMLKGEVHDENASALGGVAGHAGLFGTVDGVLDFALGLLNGSGASPAALRAMRQRASHTRTCGWERRVAGWSGGDACSDMTIGQTGLTGTGLWIDFERGLAWTLLTNAVHPTRHVDSGITALQRRTGDAVIGAFDCP